jgi:hypothetical protein
MRFPASRLFWFFMFFCLSLSEVNADSMPQNWTVLEATGAVNIKATSGLDLGSQAGTKLDPPFTIQTGANGHAVITHGMDKLTISPNTMSTVPLAKSIKTGLITRIQQTIGSILYHVEHRITDRFEVDTPYLVSVVKGTTFNIRVTPDASNVTLIEGKLLVYTPDKKSELILKPGQAAIKTKKSKVIILKDQQSLSNLKPGPITIIKDSGSPLVAVSGTSNNTIPGGENKIYTGVNAFDISTNTSIGGGSALSVDANVGGVSAGTSIGGGSALSVDANVGGVSAGTSIGGGSALSVDANVGGVSAGTSIGGGSALNAGVSVPDNSTNSGLLGNVIRIIFPNSK